MTAPIKVFFRPRRFQKYRFNPASLSSFPPLPCTEDLFDTYLSESLNIPPVTFCARISFPFHKSELFFFFPPALPHHGNCEGDSLPNRLLPKL